MILYYLRHDSNQAVNLNSRRSDILKYIENRMEETLKYDKGTGCYIPKLDPFAEEILVFDKKLPKVICKGLDWVKCFMSECKVVKEILSTIRNIKCEYRDIIYKSDDRYMLGDAVDVLNDGVYTLEKSDHVKIRCIGTQINSVLPSRWSGHATAFRNTVKPNSPPVGREDTINVLLLVFDSTSKNGFIRRMPKTYKVLKDELEAVILNGYNIVGDATIAALLPILTGHNELELPECRRTMPGSGYVDQLPFIFYSLKKDGYRTAFFEDCPYMGAFQRRLNGFRRQPTDHYLLAFFVEEGKSDKTRYCVGDTPQYKLMFNLSDQFFRLDGKGFCFTFIADISHDDFNMISTADEDLVDFLRQFRDQGRLENTMLLLWGDHGPRCDFIRSTLQGKLEERLPLMSIILPTSLKKARPDALAALRANVDVLTTPHDIHNTLLDAVGLQHLYSHYKVKGADILRGLSLLSPVPRNRSCSEAGIEPHWCTCLTWEPVFSTEPAYNGTVKAFLRYINELTSSLRSECVLRMLASVEYVMRQRVNSRLLAFQSTDDFDGHVNKFENFNQTTHNYQIKITVSPGNAVLEATVAHKLQDNTYIVDPLGVSRINTYGSEPSCISDRYPHLNNFCYCRVIHV